MKKIICVLLTVLALSLTACSSEKAEAAAPNAVCFAIANTANAQGLNLNSPLVSDTAYETIRNYGYISVVSIDGQPETLLAESYDIPAQYKNASRDKLDTDARANTTALLAGLQNVIANDPEADFLAGLRMAVRSLSGLEGYGSKTVIVLGTGLATTGTVDFRNNLLSAEPEAIIELLAERQEIPDFSGITVVWQQMGDTAAPQQPLSQRQKLTLQQIWGGIVERGGGTFVYNDIIPVPASGSGEYPAVSVVELPAEAPIRFDPEEPNAAQAELFQAPVVLTEEQVAFVGDEDVYLHPGEAEAVLRPIADYLLENTTVNILLVGTTAGDTTDAYTKNLSCSRAETVRRTLIAMGVPENRIRAVGMGASDPWHISGVGTEGKLAACNRKVVILDAASETAQDILGA